MVWHAKNSVIPLQWSSTGWMPVRMGRLSTGAAHHTGIQSQFTRLFWWQGQWGGCEYSGTRQDHSTLLLNGPGLRWLFPTLLLQPKPASCLKSAPHDISFLRIDSRGQQYVSDLSNVTPRYLGLEQKVRVSLLWLTFSFLVLEKEDCRHCFCNCEPQLPSLEVSTYSCYVFPQHPFHYLPASISMHDC